MTTSWETIYEGPGEVVYHVGSDVTGDVAKVTVRELFPDVLKGGLGPRPVVYVLDEIATLDAVVGTARHFQLFCRGAIDMPLVVGIGYPDTNDIQARRFRDFTPTRAKLPVGLNFDPPFGTGKAAAFLNLLSSEIIPGLESRHPLSSLRTLVGYSLSGRFALHVLFDRPSLFRNYIVISPSFWWDAFSVLGDEATWATNHNDLPVRLFLAVGLAEERPSGPVPNWRNDSVDDDTMRELHQVTTHRAFVQRLRERRYPNLRFLTAEFEDERHSTVFPAAFSRGWAELAEES